MALSPKLSQQEAERCARDLLDEMEIAALPVLPIEIAKRKDILVQPFRSDKPGFAGCLMMQDNRFGIGYADHLDNEGFVNFTVGHELGHYHLPGHVDFLFSDGQTVHYSASAFTSSKPHERQADNFSAALLMPEHLFVPALRFSGPGLKGVKTISGMCKTSLNATAIRYGQLAEDPVAVVVSLGQDIDYAFVSPTLKEILGPIFIRRGDPLPRGSATARFNRDIENVLRSENVESTCCLSEWFEGAPVHEMNEDVIGLGKYGKTLTILFTQDEIEVDDSGEEEED